MKNKKILKLFLGVLIAIFVLAIIVTFNFENHSVFSCGYSEREFKIPTSLKESKIVFEKPMYVWKDETSNFHCIDSLNDTDHVVNHLGAVNLDPFLTEIELGKEFSIYKMLEVSCNALICMDGGSTPKILLKDDTGIIYTIDFIGYFDAKRWATVSSGQFLYKAGYYRKGIRTGDLSDVILQKWE